MNLQQGPGERLLVQGEVTWRRVTSTRDGKPQYRPMRHRLSQRGPSGQRPSLTSCHCTCQGLLNCVYSAPTGNIASWKVKVGDAISAGDSVAEIETDKATMDWEAQEDGFIAAILVPDGTRDLDINAPCAVVVEDEVLIRHPMLD